MSDRLDEDIALIIATCRDCTLTSSLAAKDAEIERLKRLHEAAIYELAVKVVCPKAKKLALYPWCTSECEIDEDTCRSLVEAYIAAKAGALLSGGK